MGALRISIASLVIGLIGLINFPSYLPHFIPVSFVIGTAGILFIIQAYLITKYEKKHFIKLLVSRISIAIGIMYMYWALVAQISQNNDGEIQIQKNH